MHCGPIHCIENHDEAYYLWRQAGFSGRTLVHVDAHHDMWWMDDASELSIANFICAAIRDGIVARIFWVVPDASWDSSGRRAAIRQHLTRLTSQYSGSQTNIQWHPRGATLRLGQVPLIVCSLDALPVIEEPVLLDIDIDYFTIPAVAYGRADWHSPLPWRWPRDLTPVLDQRLRATPNTDPVFTTIAYSVEGGYTPLAWKHLGDDMAGRLGGTTRNNLSAYDALHDAAEARRRGDVAAATEVLLHAREEACAPAHLHLAYLLLESGRTNEAKQHHETALALDPSYRTPFASPGFQLWWGGRRQRAAAAFTQTLQLNPNDACAYVGLGWIAEHERRWSDAELAFRGALALDETLVDAYRGLGRALTRLQQPNEAIAAYERSLRLAMAGYRPLRAPIVTAPEVTHLRDPDHAAIHLALARLYEQKGETARAITGYRIALAAGIESPSTRQRLAKLQAASA